MVRNKSALGIIFPNNYDGLVPELTSIRSMASIPFASRYRLIDFVLSSMVDAGIDNISVLAQANYRSLMDHLGAGREWDLTRKNGGLTLWPPFARKDMVTFKGRIDSLAHIINFLRAQKEQYVILTDTNIAATFDFKAFIDAHIASGADVTVAYTVEELPAPARENKQMHKDIMYFTYKFDENGRATKIAINTKEDGPQNLGMNIYCISREYLVRMVEEEYMNGAVYLERDILMRNLDTIHVHGYHFDRYYGRIHDMKSYLAENLRLLDDDNLNALFSGFPVYTKLRDDNPTRYIAGAKVVNTMAADGCVIEGTVENCVLFRGVKIGKGAVVKNCVLMQDTVIEPNVSAEYIITDKNAVISAGKDVKGSDTYPFYVSKRQTI